MKHAIPLILTFALFAGTADAQTSNAAQTDALAKVLQPLLLDNLPEPLYDKKKNWGNQKYVTTGIRWERTGKFRLKPIKQQAHRNDGHWQHITVYSIRPDKTLALGIQDLQYPEAGTATFTALLGMDVRIVYRNQVWKSGARIYGGETHARCRVAAKLEVELVNHIEMKPGNVLPEAVMRVRVTKANVYYTDPVCEHILGLDGEAARKLGAMVHKAVKEFVPDLETVLLAKANAAIVKAGDSKPVRVSFEKLLLGKPPTITREENP